MLDMLNLRLQQGAFNLLASVPNLSPKIYAVMGPSGAGKSTLLAALAGFVPVQSGTLSWQGIDITSWKPADRPMAMLFQDNNLFPHLTAERNIALAVTQHRTLTKSTRQKILTALMRVGLEGFGDYKPGQLSGGQQSRVALARVLLQDKPIVLLDEPFNALGPALKNDMLDLLQILAHERKSLVLMVTHNPEDALRIAHETLLVSDEQVSLPVSTPDLLANPPPALATYLGKRVTVQ